MNVEEKEVIIPRPADGVPLMEYFERTVNDMLVDGSTPVRFVVTGSDSDNYYCELGIVTDDSTAYIDGFESIFRFRERPWELEDEFTTVLLVPTGIGAAIGGHAGDATPVAKLLSSVSSTLITHPNVVNASDINELTDNSLYVEGSVITQLLMGTVGLQQTRSNRILVVIDEHMDYRIKEDTVNAVSAARATLGLDGARVVEMTEPVEMRAEWSSSGRAVGRIQGLERLCSLISQFDSDVDAVALASIIDVPPGVEAQYFSGEGDLVNPWGGVEAMLTHALSSFFKLPCAHAPMPRTTELANEHYGIVDPRKAAECVSVCFLHCVLKGLYRSPRIVLNPDLQSSSGLLTVTDVSCLVIPDSCLGLPTLAAMKQGVPVIAVRENRNCMKNRLEDLPFQDGKLFIVDNYLEATGVISALRSGISPASVRRPLAGTRVYPGKSIIQKKTGDDPVRVTG